MLSDDIAVRVGLLRGIGFFLRKEIVEVEEMIERTLTNEERTVIKALLTDEAERICHNLQDAVEKALEA